MKIDESSLDGTIEVIDTMVIRTLQLNNTGLREHGVMFAGGDLLSLSLTDKVRLSFLPRRDYYSFIPRP
jgi:hypothetical protein